ncbi:hypothetical protein EHS25_009290 [Saitozyma podzolica]|uniref:Uncharacterized protein n=1 Tax=Saitozyma podzolica TaxID=1890683 RepID=A0A427YLI0_9TREE|nr:hypothetical protein EHS25_009290 [Saitozyma podzolica]
MLEIVEDASRLLEVDAEADDDGVAEVDEVGPADMSADEETAELTLAVMLELDATALDIELAAEGTNTT